MQQSKVQSGIALIAQERQEQIYKHGFSLRKDQKYYSFDVFRKAAVSILECDQRKWPENDIPVKYYHAIVAKDKIAQVACAGALLAAEIDYLQIHKVCGLSKEAPCTECMTNIEQDTFLLGQYDTIDTLRRLFAEVEAEQSHPNYGGC